MVTRITLIVTSLWGLAFSFISWFPAFPPSAFWDLIDSTAVRYGIGSLQVDIFVGAFVALNASNMVLDIITLAIPVPFYLRSRELAWKARLSLMGLFTLGTL